MNRQQVYEVFQKMSPEAKRTLTRSHQGWAFQMPPKEDAWWEEPVEAKSPGFGKSTAETFLQSVFQSLPKS